MKCFLRNRNDAAREPEEEESYYTLTNTFSKTAKGDEKTLLLIRPISRRKGNLQILGNIGSGHHQIYRYERINDKRIPHDNEKTTQNQTTEQKFQQKDKYQDCPLRKILETIL